MLGTIDVPAGYYDRGRGVWVPSDNGRIIAVLSTSAGVANLDINGDGQPDTGSALSDLGINDAERAQLAVLYPPGRSFWRVPIRHFSAWDFNWGFGPPPSADAPL